MSPCNNSKVAHRNEPQTLLSTNKILILPQIEDKDIFTLYLSLISKFEAKLYKILIVLYNYATKTQTVSYAAA